MFYSANTKTLNPWMFYTLVILAVLGAVRIVYSLTNGKLKTASCLNDSYTIDEVQTSSMDADL